LLCGLVNENLRGPKVIMVTPVMGVSMEWDLSSIYSFIFFKVTRRLYAFVTNAIKGLKGNIVYVKWSF
jgi:hypothetical protein